MTEYTPLITAFLGFVACEALNILPAIKREDTPDKFSLSYYFSRPTNQVLLVLNACGSAILFISRHEVVGLAEHIPVVSDYLGATTPYLVCGVIGFSGGYFVRWMAKAMSKAE